MSGNTLKLFPLIITSEKLFVVKYPHLDSKNIIQSPDLYHKINLVPMGKFQRAFIHFHHWYDYDKSLKVRKILLDNKDFKIIYVHPWFWKCSIVYQ